MATKHDNIPPGKCRIAEIVQYTCNVETSESSSQLHCFPIPRLFKICPDRPTVEITTMANIDMTTGEVDVPPDTRKIEKEGKTWRNVILYNKDNGKAM
ncbi:hypothetical protein L208DRAFT_1438855 [Tricholoma matsutake]|nr:hypothetical protein L208DRAFT_1438855 [Tricholoma matsutake 945]